MKKLTETDQISTFKRRLFKIGIDISLIGNYPWVYLDSINGVSVKEKRFSEHRYTIGWIPISPGKAPYIEDHSDVIKLIRKYL